MKKLIHFFLMLGVLCVCAALPAVAAAQDKSETTAPVEATIPSPLTVRLKGLDGKVYDVAQMRGQVVMVSFGATWCAPCVWELAAIEELKQEYKGKPVRFLWVSIEGEEETSDTLLRHYAKSHRMTIPVLRDPLKETVARFSERVRIPLVVFFDRNGQFVAPAHRGMSQDTTQYKQSMRTRIDALLGQSAATPASPVTTAASGTNASH